MSHVSEAPWPPISGVISMRSQVRVVYYTLTSLITDIGWRGRGRLNNIVFVKTNSIHN